MPTRPDNLRYSRTHEYVNLEGEIATIGITDYATEELGDVVFVELPKVGAHYDAGKTFGVVESVKAVSDLYLPIGGTVTAVNTTIEGEPALVNKDPFGAGWMVKLKVDDPGQVAKLMSRQEYDDAL